LKTSENEIESRGKDRNIENKKEKSLTLISTVDERMFQMKAFEMQGSK
jgi:hypothetical protein